MNEILKYIKLQRLYNIAAKHQGTLDTSPLNTLGKTFKYGPGLNSPEKREEYLISTATRMFIMNKNIIYTFDDIRFRESDRAAIVVRSIINDTYAPKRSIRHIRCHPEQLMERNFKLKLHMQARLKLDTQYINVSNILRLDGERSLNEDADTINLGCKLYFNPEKEELLILEIRETLQDAKKILNLVVACFGNEQDVEQMRYILDQEDQVKAFYEHFIKKDGGIRKLAQTLSQFHMRKKQLEKEIEQNNSDIEKLYQQIIQKEHERYKAQEQLRKFEEQKTENFENRALERALKRNDNLLGVRSSINDQKNTVIYLDYVGPVQFDKSIIGGISNPGLRQLLLDTKDDKTTLMIGVTVILEQSGKGFEITFDRLPRTYTEQLPENLEILDNPHLINYKCMGSFEHHIKSALNVSNWDIALEYMSQMATSINPIDIIVMNRLMESTTMCIYLPKEKAITSPKRYSEGERGIQAEDITMGETPKVEFKKLFDIILKNMEEKKDEKETNSETAGSSESVESNGEETEEQTSTTMGDVSEGSDNELRTTDLEFDPDWEELAR